MSVNKSFGKTEVNNVSPDVANTESTPREPRSIDELVDSALAKCEGLPHYCNQYVAQINELRNRLSTGQLHLAVLGQFNRGKSTFINALIRHKILPTSVLPVTSVPTFISYDDSLSCKVRFLNNKPDLVVKQSIENITVTLSKYVAEENNPRNQFCVKDVHIGCPSTILQNGTMLIDTPGFGSTYVHNTRTALDTLVDCDAALFLLSADPPMTQTEVEFLKQVQQYVPRIFFILNKIDLLGDKDIDKVDRFIRQMLISHLGYSSDVKLFHVCAAEAEKAFQNAAGDTDWSAGNMDQIKTEILEFMIREKYFTLSQALNDKLRDAFEGIITSLQKDADEKKLPLELLRKEKDELLTRFDEIKKNMEKDLKLIQIEKDAVIKYINENLSTHKEQMVEQVFAHLDNLLVNSSGGLSWIQGLVTAIGAYINDSFANLYLSMIARINKPVRKAALLHSKEYNAIADSVEEFVPGANRKSFLLEKLENMEIGTEESWKAGGVVQKLDTRFAWNDHLRSRQSKARCIRNKWDEFIKGAITADFDSLEAHLKTVVDGIFEKIKSLLSEEYFFLSQDLDSIVEKKEKAVNERLNRKNNSVEPLEKMAAAFLELKNELV
jgi:GTP-binding protein EngB required for normal cell division